MAAAALFVWNALGWMGYGCTLRDWRRRGGQGALIAQRIAEAAALGCRWVVTETGQETASYRNMRRAGLEVAYLRSNYLVAFARRGSDEA